jgi:predicted short-subunit dehydrogenase-like oxidoreductase (DUF2520 family)
VVRSIRVVGAGRVGSAVSARLRERGVELREDDAELWLLCVPDRAIAEVATEIEPGPWVAHVSGATPLSALAPHEKRLCVHPLQTIVRGRGPEQLDGAYAAVTAERPEALELGFELARVLGLEPFELADGDKPLYHAAAAFACGYLVTLYRIAASLFEQVGAPPKALVPLMSRTIENDFELTGPAARGDWTTVEAHLRALHERRPELEHVYRALAEATGFLAPRESLGRPS